jgi:hypothetical protein
MQSEHEHAAPGGRGARHALSSREAPTNTQRDECRSRRQFLGGLTLAGTAGLLGLKPERLAAEPPPETTNLRLAFRIGLPCHTPLHVADEFLYGEGFTVDRGYTAHDFTLHALKEIPYGKWHEYDPEDTVRFYALRLHEAGMIKASPQKIITRGTDWRFLRELKKELKG